MSLATFRAAYAADRIGRPWGFRSTDYAGGYHRGLDVRRQNPGKTASIVTEVVAISDGVVDYVGRPNLLLGPVVRIKRDAGGYEFHCHTVASVGVGDRVMTGTVLGRNARLNERPGQIDGVHDHIVFSDFADGAWNTRRPTRDPLPLIRSILAAPAGGGTTPLPIPEEDTLSAAEVADIKATITQEAAATRRLAAGTPGAGARLVRYAKSAATGTIFALYDNPAGGKFRVRVVDPSGIEDATVLPQADLWAYDEWPVDGVAVRPGVLTGYATSAVTGNIFALYVDSNGSRTRRLLTAAPIGAVPTVAQDVLWLYAPVNQS